MKVVVTKTGYSGGRKYGGSKPIKNEVLLVNKYETGDRLWHIDTWDKKGMGTTFGIKKWKDAKKFAEKYARKLGLNQYTIDNPGFKNDGIVKLKKVV